MTSEEVFQKIQDYMSLPIKKPVTITLRNGGTILKAVPCGFTTTNGVTYINYETVTSNVRQSVRLTDIAAF